ncbi:MAG: MFS transporter [Hyphomicrobiaceae bacterium]|nr:MFS transporter [Hyphomicrobiaceae bacterium]
MNGSSPAVEATGPWAPFTHAPFTVLWIAAVVSNVGNWMHDVGAGWLMTELSQSPAVVATVQAATTLPVFLFVLFAGAIADIVDRRWLLIGVNIFNAVVAGTLAVLVALDQVTPIILIAFTLLLATGTAVSSPAWQALLPALVPREKLASAIALNSMGINIARAIGPAIAGFLIVAVGLWSPFALNALSFAGIILALLWWRPPARPAGSLPPEDVGTAVVAGLRYAANSAPLGATLLRAVVFFLFASAFWALLPLIAREELQGDATLYGLLLTSVGVGAVGGALLLPIARTRLGIEMAVFLAALAMAVSLVVLALVPHAAVAVVAAALAGLSWITVLSSLNLSAQSALPDWVRARGMSIYLMIFYGSMAIGSLIWGQVASYFGISAALQIAAVGTLLGTSFARFAKLNLAAGQDLAPALHWPAPVVDPSLMAADRITLIVIRYAVPDENRARFQKLMQEMAKARRRYGGYRWSLVQDVADPATFLEVWQEASWTQHLRHHERVTGADHQLQQEIQALLAHPCVVAHFVAPAD